MQNSDFEIRWCRYVENRYDYTLFLQIQWKLYLTIIVRCLSWKEEEIEKQVNNYILNHKDNNLKQTSTNDKTYDFFNGKKNHQL